jgi:hypothetical protein
MCVRNIWRGGLPVVTALAPGLRYSINASGYVTVNVKLWNAGTQRMVVSTAQVRVVMLQTVSHAWSSHSTRKCGSFPPQWKQCGEKLFWRYLFLLSYFLKIALFWDDEPCCLVDNCRCFSGAYWLHHQAPLKRRSVSTRQHGETSQKTEIFILVAVKTWNLVLFPVCLFVCLKYKSYNV